MRNQGTQRMRPKYYEPVEAQLQAIFYDILFRPLVSVVEETTSQSMLNAHGMLNAEENPLQHALRTGRVQYDAGKFSGEFNAAISRVLKALGAKFDHWTKTFSLDPASVPGWVKAQSASYQATARGAHETINRKLSEIQGHLDSIVAETDVDAKPTLHAVQKDFRQVAGKLTVRPELSEDSVGRLSKQYNENMKLWIKKFSQEMIGDLRGVVEKNAQQGYRFDKLIQGIQGRYGVAQNKAKFLARQETALFMSKYRKERFSESGITHYRWSTSHDERVRPAPGTTGIARLDDHRRLDGHTFAYNNPPVVDRNTGRRANPGEDYNCRCVDIPVVERAAVAA